MLHAEKSILIHAPQQKAAGIYRDYHHWPGLFPTIHGVRLVREEAGKTYLEIDHREGKVVNILTDVSPAEIHLQEFKKLYNAQFLNRFEPDHGDTCYTVIAEVSVKGIAKILEPFLGGYIRKQISQYVLEPVKQAAERQVQAAHPEKA